MSKMRFENTKAGGFLAKKGFYIALAVCLIAIGGATWTAINTIGRTPDSLDSQYNEQYTLESTSDVSMYVVDNPVSDVPVESSQTPAEESSETDTEDTTAAQENGDEDNEAASSEETANSSPYYVIPVSGQITKIYNPNELQYSKTYQDWRLHLGIDIEAEKGAQVVSAANGVISEVYEDQLMGNTVIIEHSTGVVAYYSGLDSIVVQKGDEIKASAPIGSIGEVPCEASDVPHLHFAMKQNDEWVSPLETMGMLNE